MSKISLDSQASNCHRNCSTCADVITDTTAVEFKQVVKTSHGPLSPLDGTMIEVEFPVGGGMRSVKGRGQYASGDPDFGNVLRILVADPQGDFEFILPESSWKGQPIPSELPDCDYRISLVDEGAE